MLSKGTFLRFFVHNNLFLLVVIGSDPVRLFAFSLARMIKVTETGQVIYRAVKSGCVRFPNPGDERLRQGVSRNFQVFEPLEESTVAEPEPYYDYSYFDCVCI